MCPCRPDLAVVLWQPHTPVQAVNSTAPAPANLVTRRSTLQAMGIMSLQADLCLEAAAKPAVPRLWNAGLRELVYGPQIGPRHSPSQRMLGEHPSNAPFCVCSAAWA